MQFVPMLVVSTFIKKCVDFVKYAAVGDVNAVVTQVVAWVVGVATVFVTANSDFGNEFAVNSTTLRQLNTWALVLVGLNVASFAGVGWDTIKAVDSSNSAVVPNLLARTTAPQAPPGSPPITGP